MRLFVFLENFGTKIKTPGMVQFARILLAGVPYSVTAACFHDRNPALPEAFMESIEERCGRIIRARGPQTQARQEESNPAQAVLTKKYDQTSPIFEAIEEIAEAIKKNENILHPGWNGVF